MGIKMTFRGQATTLVKMSKSDFVNFCPEMAENDKKSEIYPNLLFVRFNYF